MLWPAQTVTIARNPYEGSFYSNINNLMYIINYVHRRVYLFYEDFANCFAYPNYYWYWTYGNAENVGTEACGGDY